MSCNPKDITGNFTGFYWRYNSPSPAARSLIMKLLCLLHGVSGAKKKLVPLGDCESDLASAIQKHPSERRARFHRHIATYFFNRHNRTTSRARSRNNRGASAQASAKVIGPETIANAASMPCSYNA